MNKIRIEEGSSNIRCTDEADMQKKRLLIVLLLLLLAEGLVAGTWKCIDMMSGYRICELFDDAGNHTGTVIYRH